jgi:hypothetical protein
MLKKRKQSITKQKDFSVIDNNAHSYDLSMIPSDISIDENLLPYVINRQYGYGKRFNAFITPNSNCYHLSRCSALKNKKKTVLHRYIAMNKYKPCSICTPKYLIEDWYIDFLKKNAIISNEDLTHTNDSSEVEPCKQITLFD